MVLQNHGWVKDPLKIQNTPKDFNVAKYEKLIDMISNYTLQLACKKLPLTELWYNIKRNIYSYMKKLLKYSSLFNYISV